jgi:hypothetical protein
VNRRLLTAYAAASYGEESLFRPGRATDYRAHKIPNLVEAEDVPVVAENDPYVDIAVQTDSVVSSTIAKHGALVPFSYEVFKNDDALGIARSIDNIGRSARRTLAKAVWALWSSNADYGPDTTDWFHANHSNYGTTALSADAAGTAAVVAAVRKPSTRRGRVPREARAARRACALWLTVPNALWDVAYWVNQQASSPLYHLFGADNENVIVNPLLTDATDWA